LPILGDDDLEYFPGFERLLFGGAGLCFTCPDFGLYLGSVGAFVK